MDTHLQSVITQLPQGWHLCYLGWHGQSVLHLALGEKPTTKPIEVEDLHFGVQPRGFACVFLLVVFITILCGDMYCTCCFFLLSLLQGDKFMSIEIYMYFCLNSLFHLIIHIYQSMSMILFLQAVEEKIHRKRDHRTDAPHYACRCWK